MSGARTILFAGGGTGGHIYPNVAIIEQLRAKNVHFSPFLIVSNRPIDQRILTAQQLAGAAMRTRPMTLHPLRLPGFVRSWRASVRQARALLAQHQPKAVAATGGFAAAAMVQQAAKAGVPVAMVNLDAVPGKANRWMARCAAQIFSVYETSELPGAERIGLPLRAASIGPQTKAEARQALGLDPKREMLMITGGSQGAQSLNSAVIELLGRPRIVEALADWQVLHICGPKNEKQTRAAYEAIALSSQVLAYCDRMGCAWRCATLSMSRAGAGGVAEAWANAAPCLFFPYPGHRDQHQKHNAAPMVEAGGALLFDDHQDVKRTADSVEPTLLELANQPERLAAMAQALEQSRPALGAASVANWLMQQL